MISIIIPTYNRDDDLEMCLKSIRDNSVFENEIIVMHPKTSERTEIICEKYAAISVNDGSRDGNGRLKSLWAIINEGIELAKFRHVCWLNDDCLVLPEWDKNSVAYFSKDSKVALLVLKTKGILQDLNFKVCMSEYGIPVANYGILDKTTGYRFDPSFSWFYGDVDLPMQICKQKKHRIIGSVENMVIHNHRIDLNRKNNDNDPRAQNDSRLFSYKWRKYKGVNGMIKHKNIIEIFKVDRVIKKIMKKAGIAQ